MREEEFGDGPELGLTFDYHGVVEDLPAVDHPLQSVILDMLTNLELKVLGKGDLKHGYWAVVVDQD